MTKAGDTGLRCTLCQVAAVLLHRGRTEREPGRQTLNLVYSIGLSTSKR
ncbi:hypothetical protein [Salipiger sp. PrR002]